MNKTIGLLLLLIVLVSCKGKTKKVVVGLDKNDEKALKIDSYTFSELAPLLSKNDGKTYVVNFWATWCAPCVKELPAFEKLLVEYTAKNVEVILVSLDFSSQIKTKLLPFIERNKLQSKVVLLDDPNQDEWIPKINSKWSGAIPATLIYNAQKRKFYERSFDYNELETEVQKFLN